MIQIRNRLFETNSSSVNVFYIPETGSLKIPKEIKMSELTRDIDCADECVDTITKIAFMYNEAKDVGNGNEFIRYLTRKGIKIIDDLDDNDYDEFMCSQHIDEIVLDHLLFNDDTLCLLNPDYRHKDGYKKVEFHH